MRRSHEEIRELGADVAMIGTGDARHARSFVAEEAIPFPVLVDDEARAAGAASIRDDGFLALFTPRSFPGTLDAWRRGHRVGKPGRRVTQLGASFVLGPGSQVRYTHLDAHPADHAPLAEILGALRS